MADGEICADPSASVTVMLVDVVDGAVPKVMLKARFAAGGPGKIETHPVAEQPPAPVLAIGPVKT